ncbi:Uncharacterised protein [Porphyromonas macacae]|uniref:DUF5689 domain-containing protein n=2 Tax=Porphyromonas macacae TaxID=28115 RepID=A0A379DJ03_9PORP|nr:DUF5689 domain-containing protein [Porphyromonas macacae]SUB78359.1 Uncharacterised protein [Porphyromonas macacae]
MYNLKFVSNSIIASIALLTVFLGFTGCKDNDDRFEMPYLKIESPYQDGGTLKFDKEGGTISIKMNTNRNWHVEKGDSWFEVSPDKGHDGSHVITVSIGKNPGAGRLSVLKIKTLSSTVSFVIDQKGEENGGGDVLPPDDEEKPKPEPEPEPAGGIPELLNMGKALSIDKGTMVVDKEITFRAVVTTDYNGKNFPFRAYHHVQDTEGNAIVLTVSKGGEAYAFGTKLTVKAKGCKLTNYSGTIQLEVTNDKVVAQPNHPITPKTVTIPDIMSGKYDLAYVKVEDVHIENPEGKLYDGTFSTKRHKVVDEKNNWLNMEIWKTAVFGGDSTPKGRGSIIAVVTVSMSKDGQKTYRNLRPSVRADIALEN